MDCGSENVFWTEFSKEPKARKNLVSSKNREAEDLARTERVSGRESSRAEDRDLSLVEPGEDLNLILRTKISV